MENDSILESTRTALGVGSDATDFDPELILHINAALAIVHQNGCGKSIIVVDKTMTWGDFKDETQINGNGHSFQLVPHFVFTKTKILFDPPPPSNVSYYDTYTQELLWRIRTAYEADQPILI